VKVGPKFRNLIQEIRDLYVSAIDAMNCSADADHLIDRIGAVQEDLMAEWKAAEPVPSLADEIHITEMFILSVEYRETLKHYAAARGFPIEDTLPDELERGGVRNRGSRRVPQRIRIHRKAPRSC
jgi:hypothetical protein